MLPSVLPPPTGPPGLGELSATVPPPMPVLPPVPGVPLAGVPLPTEPPVPGELPATVPPPVPELPPVLPLPVRLPDEPPLTAPPLDGPRPSLPPTTEPDPPVGLSPTVVGPRPGVNPLMDPVMSLARSDCRSPLVKASLRMACGRIAHRQNSWPRTMRRRQLPYIDALATAGTHCCPGFPTCAKDDVVETRNRAMPDKAKACERFIRFTYKRLLLGSATEQWHD